MNVEARGVTVRFGATLALDAVDFQATQGGIHALVGENGAGKTTLMRVLYGAIAPDQGGFWLDGTPVRFRSSREAIAAGVGMVSQHYSVIPELSCLENLLLGAEPGWAIPLADAARRAGEYAARMGYEFDWRAPASTLGPAGSQKLEILKLLWRRSRIMVLDEPTAMLSPADSDALYASLARLASEGATVIVVTHRLSEVLRFAGRVTVLRGGRLVGAWPVSEVDGPGLARLIVGEGAGTPAAHERSAVAAGGHVLEVAGLEARGYRGDLAVHGADLAARTSEVVGIAGVDGNGQRELFRALSGTLASSGSVRVAGEDWSGLGAAARIRRGLRVIPEDRHKEAVVEEWSLVENAALGLQRTPEFSRGPWLRRDRAAAASQAIAERFHTRHPGLDRPMAMLSGGNQQRFVAARALHQPPSLLLAFQPARGLDFRGTEEVYAGIRSAVAGRACALVASFDLDELLEHCDRVVVMSRGKVLEPPAGSGLDRAAISRLMTEAA